MGKNDNDQLVVGLFANENAAIAAADDIKEWDEWERKDIKLGAMAVMTIDRGSGKLHAKEIGQRSTRSGLKWGTAIGAVAAIFSGGLALIPGLILGGAAGAAAGSLNHKSVGMTDEQHDALVEALKMGGAALAIMCDDFEKEAVITKLADEGANVSHYVVPAETAVAIVAAADAQSAAEDAIDEAVDDVQDAVDQAADAVADAVPDLTPDHVEHVSRLTVVTGMSAAEAAKFHDAGIEKVSGLLAAAATPDGRKELSEQTGIDEADILFQAKKLDLMRVKGVGVTYATLLLAAGVDTVPELATRNPANLAAKCEEVNKADNITEAPPSEATVADWVGQAKEMPRMLYY